jgi:ParB family chromosome partitioning protein
MSKAVLGKGLKALFPSMDDDTPRQEELKTYKIKSDTEGLNIIARIEIKKIDSNPFQPRIKFDPVALQELKQSIVEKGIIQPITVRRKGADRYELISGERRIRAAIDAGLVDIPAYIINVSSDLEMLELALIENIQREYLNPIETAQAFQKLLDDYNYTQEELAKKVGKDRTTITNSIRLLKLPDKIKGSLENNEITTGHARALINLPNTETQLAVWQKIIKRGLSVREVEKIVQLRSEGKKSLKIKQMEPVFDPVHEMVISRIRDKLSTKVSIERNKNIVGGKILIEFYSDDDLNRLIDLFETIQNNIG